jgi:integrase
MSAQLRKFTKLHLPNAHIFNMPGSDHTARMIRADLKAAGIEYRDDAGRVADFHCLRHTFVSNLAGCGVHPKTAQTLARHSTIALTMDRYTHDLPEQSVRAVAKLPDLTHAPQLRTSKATGGEGKSAAGGRLPA